MTDSDRNLAINLADLLGLPAGMLKVVASVTRDDVRHSASQGSLSRPGNMQPNARAIFRTFGHATASNEIPIAAESALETANSQPGSTRRASTQATTPATGAVTESTNRPARSAVRTNLNRYNQSML